MADEPTIEQLRDQVADLIGRLEQIESQDFDRLLADYAQLRLDLDALSRRVARRGL